MKSFYCPIFFFTLNFCVALGKKQGDDEVENPFGRLDRNNNGLNTRNIPSKPCGHDGAAGGSGSGTMERLTFNGCQNDTSCILKGNKWYYGLVTFKSDKNYTSLNSTIKAFFVNHHWNPSDPRTTLKTKTVDHDFIENRTGSVNYELSFSTKSFKYESGKYYIELRLASVTM